MDQQHDKNINPQGATNAAFWTNSQNELEQRSLKQECFAKFYKEHIAEAESKGQIPLPINEFAKQYDFLVAKRLAELSDAEKAAKNSTASVIKQPEDLTQKPIQPDVKESNAEKESISVQPMPEDDKSVEKSEQVSPETEDEDADEDDVKMKALKNAMHELRRYQDDKKVGYKKPPKEHQFKKGQSGNPNGRPKKPKPKTLRDAMILTLNGDIKSMKNVKVEDLPLTSAVAISMCKSALGGKISAMKWLYEHYGTIEFERIVNGMQEREIKNEFEPTPEEYREIRENLFKLYREELEKEKLAKSQKEEENHNLNKTNQKPY